MPGSIAPPGAGTSRILLASSNQGKLREFIDLAAGSNLQLALLSSYDELPIFEENANTFAENALGKALYYSSTTSEIVVADDSGLVVPALNGAPGVHSARYAGPDATPADRITKLLREMRDVPQGQRQARFVCVIAAARQGRALLIVSGSVEGEITGTPSGDGGFGYDPVFLLPHLGRTMAQLCPEEKNQYSHRGKAFGQLSELLIP